MNHYIKKLRQNAPPWDEFHTNLVKEIKQKIKDYHALLSHILVHHSVETNATCDTVNSGVPLTIRQPVEFLWISGDPMPHCCVPFIEIHIFTKNRAESPFFGELYPTYNLYNPFRVSTNVVLTTQGPSVHIPYITTTRGHRVTRQYLNTSLYRDPVIHI